MSVLAVAASPRSELVKRWLMKGTVEGWPAEETAVGAAFWQCFATLTLGSSDWWIARSLGAQERLPRCRAAG